VLVGQTLIANSLSFAFWLQRYSALFRWLRVTTFIAYLQAVALLMGTLLDVYQIGLLVFTPFLPALRIDG